MKRDLRRDRRAASAWSAPLGLFPVGIEANSVLADFRGGGPPGGASWLVALDVEYL